MYASTWQFAAGEVNVVNGNVARPVECAGGFEEDGEMVTPSTERHLSALPHIATATRLPPQDSGARLLTEHHLQLVHICNSMHRLDPFGS